MWLFAYGSLIFRPAFDFVEQRRAFVDGYARRFWQGSPDHRGVPEAPGRVVTLVPREGETCGGVAYRVESSRADAILAVLDDRERAGFVRKQLPLREAPRGEPFAEGTVYVADVGNPHFLGQADPDADERAIAAWIARSHGPSGANRDYAVLLHEALRAIGVDDPHVEAIVVELK